MRTNLTASKTNVSKTKEKEMRIEIDRPERIKEITIGLETPTGELLNLCARLALEAGYCYKTKCRTEIKDFRITIKEDKE